jgi:hypothetical protein
VPRAHEQLRLRAGQLRACRTADDFALESFSIERDRQALLPMIQAAQRMAQAGGRELKLLASPWSPPAWMKDSGRMNDGGRLRPECRAAWAQCFVRFIQAYAAEGVPIWGVSVQNEPEARQRWDSCLYSAEEERDFVRDHLGPALHAAGLGHGAHRRVGPQPRRHGRARQRHLRRPEAARYIWGTGFHWYVEDHFDHVQLVHDAWPDKQLLFTEGCQEGGPHWGRWELAERYARSILNDLNRWTVGWIDWNLLLDEQGGPNHVGNFCSAPMLADLVSHRRPRPGGTVLHEPWPATATCGLSCPRPAPWLPAAAMPKAPSCPTRRWTRSTGAGNTPGPRTWIRIARRRPHELWQPFAPQPTGKRAARRSVWKNLSGTRIRCARTTRRATWLRAGMVDGRRPGPGAHRTPAHNLGQSAACEVLDGLLNLMPPGIGVTHASTMSSLADAYKWNEAAAAAARDVHAVRPHLGPRRTQGILRGPGGLARRAATRPRAPCCRRIRWSAFCRGEARIAEPLTRGRRGAFLVQFDAGGRGPRMASGGGRALSRRCRPELVQSLEAGGARRRRSPALAANTAGVDELLARADGSSTSGDPMAAAHHRANVLFNIMRGGVFVDGTPCSTATTCWPSSRSATTPRARCWPPRWTGAGPLEPRALAATLPVPPPAPAGRAPGAGVPAADLQPPPRRPEPARGTGSRSGCATNRAGASSTTRATGATSSRTGRRCCPASRPTRLDDRGLPGRDDADGYNPYRIGRDGIDWEVVEPDNPWSHIGYWGDHQVVYLLRCWRPTQAHASPALLDGLLWDRALFSFADVPYRKPHHRAGRRSQGTIDFDAEADAALARAHGRSAPTGCWCVTPRGQPVLATLAEKLAIIVLAKAGNLVPGGGLWLHTQRPEWNDANNALVGMACRWSRWRTCGACWPSCWRCRPPTPSTWTPPR